MAAKKQEITKHKATISRRPVLSSKSDTAQVFDIVPRGRVRANATSRPVITGNKPEVSDNTLATAPMLGLKHRAGLSISPLSSKSEDKATAAPETTAALPNADTEAKASKTAAPEEKGVSVGELLAKRAEAKSGSDSVDGSDDSGASAAKETAADSAAGTDVEVGSTIDLSSIGYVEDKEADEAGDKTTKPDPLLTLTDDMDTPAKEEDDKEETAASKNEKLRDNDIDNDEALAKALQGNTVEPQAHSEALKEEIKNLGKDGRTHYDLYGGKPVIVVHKDRSAHGVVVWILWFLVCVLLALGIVDGLLDAGIVKTNYDVPYTNFIKE